MSDILARPREGASENTAPSSGPAGAAPMPQPDTPEPPKRDPMLDLLKKFERIAAVVGPHDPATAAGLTQLVKRAAESGATAQPLFRTHVAYMLQDVEKMAGATAGTVPPELRAELTRLAGTSPGLSNPRMEALVRGTPEIADRGLIGDVRRNAATIAAMGRQQNTPQAEEMIEVLENRMWLATRFSGRVANTEPALDRPATERAGREINNSRSVPAGGEPDPVAGQTGERVRTTPSPGSNENRPGEPQSKVAQSAPQAAPTDAVPVAAKPKSLMSTIMGNASRPSNGSGPWEPPPVAMKSRIAAFEERMAAGRTDQHIRAAEKSGEQLMKAMETFMAGPGAGVLGRMENAASTEPGGMKTVMAEMQPGGRYASLRTEFDNALGQDRVFAASFNAVEKAALRYGEDRLTLHADFQARKLDASQLTTRFERADAAIGEAAEKIPGRTPGQSMVAEMADKVGEILSRAVERVRHMMKHDPDARPKPSFSPT